ncbi:MAG: histidinol-phosphate aminotransferase family protein [Firmicutes bacterium]|nr:histidinol-phosphate aminotransferase family protein [Bacillota bacterium]
MLKIRKSLLQMEKESYADDNAVIPEGAVDCTQGSNPYGFYPTVMDVVRNADENAVYHYPHGQEIYEEIENLWKDYAKVGRGNIFLGDGSIGTLYAINNIFEEPGARALSVAPTFTDATNDYKTRGMEYRYVEMLREENYKFDLGRVLDELSEEDSILYIDNPNNPTGQTISTSDIEAMIKAGAEKGVAVIIDEAYGDFIPQDESATKFLDKYDNLIVVHTFSKAFGMAAMRGGYVMASEEIIGHINKMSNPYCMNELAREAGAEALRHPEFATSHIDDFVKSNRMVREVVGNKLKMAESDDRVPICLLYHEDTSVNLAPMLAEAGLIAVPGGEFDCLNQSTVRVRMPRIEEMDKVVQAVKKVNG